MPRFEQPITLRFSNGELLIVSLDESGDGKTFDLLGPGFGEKLEAWLVIECGLSTAEAGEYIREFAKVLRENDATL